MKRAIKNHLTDFIAIIVMIVLAVVVTGYILTKEGFRLPFISKPEFTINAQFSTAQAVTPGQGQTVRVSGVQIGTLSGVEVKNGYAVVKMSIEKKYQHVIHTDATAFLRPKTGLQDMFVELNPGDPPSPTVKPGFTIPRSQTAPEVNVDEVLSSLDADTREYLQLLVNGAGQGLNNRGGELAQVLERFEPTHRDLARLNSAVAVRGADLQHLVTALRRLNDALVTQQSQISTLITSSSQVFRATASVNGQISQTIQDLPATLAQAKTTLGRVQTFAQLLGPTSTKLLPAANALPAANNALAALARPATPVIRTQVRPFVRAARPLVQQLRPAAINLANATPSLNSSFSVVNKFLNLLGYCPAGGSSSCRDSGNRQHGYLWWLAWLGHIGRTVFAVQDGNGDFRQAFIQISCASLNQILGQATGAAILSGLNLNTVLANTGLCPAQASAVQAQFRNFQSAGTSSPFSTANPSVAAQLRKQGIGNIGNQFLPKPTGH